MLCEGCVITAEGSYFKLLNGEECNQEKVDRIKNKLNNMTNYINDYVIIATYRFYRSKPYSNSLQWLRT